MASAPGTRVRATLSIAEAAWELGVCTETAYRQAKRGELPGAFKFGRRWVVSREAFERWLENR
jgi:excisionase family DNA binding protein